MPLLLRQSTDLSRTDKFDTWFATTGAGRTDLPPEKKLAQLAARLEKAFEAERQTWWDVGRELGADRTAEIAHAPTGGAFGSDFGVMLAWARLAGDLAAGPELVLCICDDPWLFRQLAGMPGVRAGPAPALWPRALIKACRGWLARAKVAAAMAVAALRLRRTRRSQAPGGPVLLVYGHPESRADGHDAYFGDLMGREDFLSRVLHTDCGPGRAGELSRDRRTASLHGWGNPLFALSLPWVRWRPGRIHREGRFGWLVRRAAAVENSGGGPAMNRWQHHCQERWLHTARPGRVIWPWENHGWERALCRAAQQYGVQTIGYQHTVIGPHQINYAVHSNPDGLTSIPDLVVADGPAYRDELLAWGLPAERLLVGGAFRFRRAGNAAYDPAGPVFVPLSAVREAARQQMIAAQNIAAAGTRVLVKDHPMYPFTIREAQNIAKTNVPLAAQSGISAVLYSTGTSGLEALLSGVPAFRLVLEDRVAIDILPADLSVPAVTPGGAAGKLRAAQAPAPLAWEQVLADPDYGLWRTLVRGAAAAGGTPEEKVKRAS